MEEVYSEAHITAIKHFCAYVKEYSFKEPSILQMGIEMVLFAKREPRLYQFIFMQHNKHIETLEDMLAQFGITRDMSVAAIGNDYGLSAADAEALFQHIWIYAFSLGTLCVTRVCIFSEEELTQMLSMQIQAIASHLKDVEKQAI